MYSAHPAYSRNIALICFLFLAWFVYLSTLSPTIFYRDTPEFVDTAFTLGISHPAGFPIYNLMAKTVTFFPMGSIAFKVNLFSSLMVCLALLAPLYGLSRVFESSGRGGRSSSGNPFYRIEFHNFCLQE